MAPTPVHNRKYLCQAPRNETWDSIRDGVIARLGDDPVAVLSTTIDQVRSLHPELERPRTGPGRKSNAEHALFFYQYLLNYVQNNRHRPTPQLSQHHRSQLTTTTSAAVASSASSDYCNVCQDDSNPEPLIPCRSCPRAFHMASCLHPQVDGDYDEWLCPYCVLEDPTTPKLKRHPAAAAVRVMARWRKQFARKRANDAAAAQQETETTVAAVPETAIKTDPVVVPPQVAEKLEEEPQGSRAAEEKRAETKEQGAMVQEPVGTSIVPPEHRTGGESKMMDAGDSIVHERVKEEGEEKNVSATEANPGPTESPAPPSDAKAAPSVSLASSGPSSPDRSRRTRKQPTLYDPQSCAASRWTTDELVEWKISSKESEDGANEEKQAPSIPAMMPSSHTAKPSVRQSVIESGEGFWCNFCRDEADITLCVFCACRVCYSKDAEDQLVCSDCDQQYHAKCIGLPRPKAMSLSWTCASCIDAKKPQKNRVVPTRTRPREPTKQRSETVVASESASPGPSRRSARAPAPRRVDPPPPDRRSAGKRAAAAANSSAPPAKRPVGRPPKNRPPVVVAAAPQPPRKRGRPPSVGPPRKRGRPPKRAKVAVEVAETEMQMPLEGTDMQSRMTASAAAIHTTRTGRTVKRSTFHDEIEQGAQFLKSSRKSPKSSPNDVSSLGGAGSSFRSTETALAAAPDAMEVDEPEAAVAVAVAPVKPPPPPPVRQESSRNPRRKPGARECMQISRRFGDKVIPDKYYDILLDYCNRGKVEHLIRMRERLDEHSRFLELQLAGLETLVQERGESDVVVPLQPEGGPD